MRRSRISGTLRLGSARLPRGRNFCSVSRAGLLSSGLGKDAERVRRNHHWRTTLVRGIARPAAGTPREPAQAPVAGGGLRARKSRGHGLRNGRDGGRTRQGAALDAGALRPGARLRGLFRPADGVPFAAAQSLAGLRRAAEIALSRRQKRRGCAAGRILRKRGGVAAPGARADQRRGARTGRGRSVRRRNHLSAGPAAGLPGDRLPRLCVREAEDPQRAGRQYRVARARAGGLRKGHATRCSP